MMNEKAQAAAQAANARRRQELIERLDEVDRFLDFGVHPLLIAQEMKTTQSALLAAARRQGRRRIVDAFQPFEFKERGKKAA